MFLVPFLILIAFICTCLDIVVYVGTCDIEYKIST
ncbi:hypothetical protein SPAB_00969 [Salmonella enterica subsp. enterica serovar Paratyphi B str. SPB7]|uniref:Uncharacterized protein n=1 Tax=Salmonella paratyphi B (strain ATCC BAA-1250 / SPB7) TaxID=1016998 RepID=A0A6C6YZS1_SALPB|nr:hypothetical protein SPAB_00969 [Salmonella enterica subsp. enterica serovar Paratyphi B str. SPB7]